MKFTHSLQFNCVPEWSEHYLAYNSLKKAIYGVERALADERREPKSASPSSPPTSGQLSITMGTAAQAESAFMSLFEVELKRVKEFYDARLQDVLRDGANLRQMAIDEAAQTSSVEALLKRIYVTIHDLRDYLEMNQTGFVRIVQKFERYVPRASSRALSRTVESVLKPTTDLMPLTGECESIMAARVMAAPIETARLSLTSLLRARVVFERSTVWQDMVEMERKVSGVEVVPNEKQVAAASAAPAAAAAAKKHGHPKQPWYVRLGKLAACLIVFGVILAKAKLEPGTAHVHLLEKDAAGHNTHHSHDLKLDDYARRAGAVCALAIMFWCLEVIPLFATAAFVPFLAVVFDVLPPSYLVHHGYIKDADLLAAKTVEELQKRISREVVAKAVFSAMFSPNIMLLIGGFSIASALSKHGIAKRIAQAVLGRAGSNPGTVLLVVMTLTTVSSMFISNVAAPVLVFTLVQPVLRALGHDDPLAKSIVLGVAYAANIGGLTSPIASPQNIITKANMEDMSLPVPSTVQWLGATVAVAPLCTVATFFVLRFFYPSNKPVPDVLTVKPNAEPFTRKQWLTTIVALLSIVSLVLTDLKAVKDHVGTLGVMAVAPLVAFFGLNLLGKEDFNGFMWNVVMIAMGGTAVGTVAKESGLLDAIGTSIGVYLKGQSFFVFLSIFSGVMLVVATFVSHSVSSAVLAPLLCKLGAKIFSPAETSTLVMVTCFVCSIGMGMPISGFPNMTAMSIDDGLGRTFIDGGDFARTGLLASVLCTVVTLTLGYGAFAYIFS